MLKKLEKFYRLMLYVLPGVLLLSYHPVIRLGSSGSMDFELSLHLIWLVVFDLVVLVVGLKKKVLLKGLSGKWVWLLLPAFLSVSILWSANWIRGLLTVGILWLVYFAGYGIFVLKDLFDDAKKEKFWKCFFGSALVICAWCVVQCFLDIFGVPREYSLMCEGCTYKSFGFPHPNGLAVEPQFMGNLLLAPAIISGWLMLKDESNSASRGRVARSRRHGARALILGRDLRKPLKALLLFIFTVTLFLTFSRGAIYAFIVAMIFMTVFVVSSERLTRDHKLGRAPLSVSRGKRFRALLKPWIIIIVAFAFTLNLQGIMAQISPTNDTYFSGVSKVLNHLSLGIIDIGKQGKTDLTKTENRVVEKPVENFESDFDGYVPESTETRIMLNDAALELWSKDFRTVLFGVGLGGAGQALYDNGLIEWPKEIVQNQFISLLLETGLVGLALLALTIVLIIRSVLKIPYAGVILTLMMAYGVSLLFFSGLPNALHIYLLPMVIFTILYERN